MRRATFTAAAVAWATACGDSGPGIIDPTPVPNRAPEAVGAIPARTVQVGETVTLDVTSYFRDPDGDPLGYTAMSSNNAIGGASVSGGSVVVVALAKGIFSVTVTARDPHGLTARQSFQVAVPNRGPEAVGAIPARTVQVGETVVLDVSPFFADPDGDKLGYEASPSDASVAHLAVSGATVTIQGVAVGETTLTVTARDPAGAGATQQATLTVTAARPDLTITGVSPTAATLAPGDSARFTFGIRNRGTGVAEAATVRALRSPNPIVSTRDTELGAWPFPSLAPSEDRAFPLTISVDPNSAPGTIYIGICVDAVTDESDTRNNCSEGVRLTIAGPSSERGSAGAGPSVRIRAARARQSRRPAKRR